MERSGKQEVKIRRGRLDELGSEKRWGETCSVQRRRGRRGAKKEPGLDWGRGLKSTAIQKEKI